MRLNGKKAYADDMRHIAVRTSPRIRHQKRSRQQPRRDVDGRQTLCAVACCSGLVIIGMVTWSRGT